MATKTKKKYSGLVSVEEMLEMKVMERSGKNNTEIAKVTGRDRHTIANGLKNFEDILVNNDTFAETLDSELKAVAEKMAENSVAIIFGADQQTANVMHEATAMEAAKITQIHANRLNGLKNLSDKGLDGNAEGVNKVVNNFIQTVINITEKNVRPEPAPTIKNGSKGDVGGGQERIVEGVV